MRSGSQGGNGTAFSNLGPTSSAKTQRDTGCGGKLGQQASIWDFMEGEQPA